MTLEVKDKSPVTGSDLKDKLLDLFFDCAEISKRLQQLQPEVAISAAKEARKIYSVLVRRGD